MPIRVHFSGKDGDLWTYFKVLEDRDETPSIESLHQSCHSIYKRYIHPFAFEEALAGTYTDPEVAVAVGDPWNSPKTDTSSLNIPTSESLSESAPSQTSRSSQQSKPKGRKKKIDQKAHDNLTFNGDQVLAQSSRFMFDAMISREVIYATADGDVGRVWEVLKVRLEVFQYHRLKFTSFPVNDHNILGIFTY